MTNGPTMLQNLMSRILAICLFSLLPAPVGSAADHSPHPLAWIHFSRNDKDISLFNGYPMHFVSGGGLEGGLGGGLEGCSATGEPLPSPTSTVSLDGLRVRS